MPTYDPSHEAEVLTEQKQKLQKPPLYKVLLHNDDFTTMEFVVFVLVQVFHKGEEEAVQIMLAVHHQGMGVAGVFTHEIAEAKINQVHNLAKAHDYPLLCTMEEE
jgi:ATP-dependent Clp protease adaptor protein ClpS